MKIIEIAPQSNGAHRNQSYNGVVPSGWAVVPDSMELENFPFGTVEAELVDGVMTLTDWTPLPMPEPEPDPEPEPTELEQLRADVDFLAVMGGVELWR